MRTVLKRGALFPLLLLAMAAGASPASAATVCASADGAPARASTVSLGNATVCLVNQERTKRGLKPLKLNRRLSKAALRHAKDMVRKQYFAHDSLSGLDFVDRIRKAGYFGKRSFPSLGEDLAYGSGELGTPRAIVQGWMESPGHRANILHKKFREAGIGVAIGDPGAGAEGATYALEFGSGGRR
jgi:uncharacterized protein YkwD